MKSQRCVAIATWFRRQRSCCQSPAGRSRTEGGGRRAKTGFRLAAKHDFEGFEGKGNLVLCPAHTSCSNLSGTTRRARSSLDPSLANSSRGMCPTRTLHTPTEATPPTADLVNPQSGYLATIRTSAHDRSMGAPAFDFRRADAKTRCRGTNRQHAIRAWASYRQGRAAEGTWTSRKAARVDSAYPPAARRSRRM